MSGSYDYTTEANKLLRFRDEKVSELNPTDFIGRRLAIERKIRAAAARHQENERNYSKGRLDKVDSEYLETIFMDYNELKRGGLAFHSKNDQDNESVDDVTTCPMPSRANAPAIGREGSQLTMEKLISKEQDSEKNVNDIKHVDEKKDILDNAKKNTEIVKTLLGTSENHTLTGSVLKPPPSLPLTKPPISSSLLSKPASPPHPTNKRELSPDILQETPYKKGRIELTESRAAHGVPTANITYMKTDNNGSPPAYMTVPAIGIPPTVNNHWNNELNPYSWPNTYTAPQLTLHSLPYSMVPGQLPFYPNIPQHQIQQQIPAQRYTQQNNVLVNNQSLKSRSGTLPPRPPQQQQQQQQKQGHKPKTPRSLKKMEKLVKKYDL